MSHYWETAAARTGGHNTADEFESAAYQLIAEQVIYYMDKRSRVPYALIERFERDFKQALSVFGVDLQVNRQLRYACAVPKHQKLANATTSQTLLALVLRIIYEEYARIGQINDNGEVVCDLVDLEEKYRLYTDRDLPQRGELNSQLSLMKRWGLAYKSEDGGNEYIENEYSDQPYVVMIRPAIIDVLGETALQRLSEWGNEANTDETDDEIADAVVNEEGGME